MQQKANTKKVTCDMLRNSTIKTLRAAIFCLATLFCCISCSRGQDPSISSDPSVSSVDKPAASISPAYIHSNNKEGVKLLTDLPESVQENIKYKIGSRPFSVDEDLITYEGLVSVARTIGLNGSIKSANIYTLKNTVVTKEIDYALLNEQKHKSCYQETITYNKDGSVSQIGSIKYTCKNGKISSAGNKKYIYGDDQLEIKYPESKDLKFLQKYSMVNNQLQVQNISNGDVGEEATQVTYNDKRERISIGKTKLGWKMESKYYYDESGRVNKVESLEQFLNKDGTVHKEDQQLTEYKYDNNGLLTWEGFTSKLIGEQITNDGRFYHFGKDENGLLNMHILECAPDLCPKGVLEHYMFDKNYNVIYYTNKSLNSGQYMIAYCVDYEYF